MPLKLPPQLYQFLVGVFAALGSFLYGYDLTIVAEVVSSQSFLNEFRPSTTEIGLVASLLTAGAFVGAALSGTFSDLLGRRATIVSGGLVFCLGGDLQTGATNYGFIIGGRFIAGVGHTDHDRTSLVTGLQQFMLGIGGVCGSWISYGTYVGFADSRQWRVPLGIQIVPAALLSALIFLFPESPRWLIKKGRREQGLATLAKLHAHGDVNNEWVKTEFHLIEGELLHEQHAEARSYRELFNNKSNLRRIALACAIQAATQMTGVSAIQYYSVTIFKQIGIDGTDTLRYQAINSVIGLLGEALVMLFIDRVGRRPVIIYGNLAMCMTYVISTILLARFPPSANNTGAHWGFIVMTWVFNFTFASMGSMSWILPAEIFDTVTRSKGVALATMTSYAFNTMIGQVTPIGMAQVRWHFYILFVVTNLTNALFFWAFLPETRKMPLEEMNVLFREAPIFIGNRKIETSAVQHLEEVKMKQSELGVENVGDHVESTEFVSKD